MFDLRNSRIIRVVYDGWIHRSVVVIQQIVRNPTKTLDDSCPELCLNQVRMIPKSFLALNKRKEEERTLNFFNRATCFSISNSDQCDEKMKVNVYEGSNIECNKKIK